MNSEPPRAVESDDAHAESFVGTGHHLSPIELRTWTGFLDAGRMLEERLAVQLQNDFAMSHRDYEVLVRLDGAGGRQRMSALASQIVASQPLITQTISRLEDRGWVRREASKADGRGVDAVLLSPGRTALAAAAGPHAALIKQLLLDPLGPDVLEQLAESMHGLAEHLRTRRRGVPCADACAVCGGDESVD